MKQKDLEILAPAGSAEQLQSAVNNGCDAVYFGLESFNARMKAPNFTSENVGEWINYCHFFGVKTYVTVNTSIKNEEFISAWNTVLTAYENNADGVIVTDLALMKLAAKLPKPFEIVASTQLNVHDKFGAEFVKKCGATTVVCARECSLEDIKEIASTGVKVEAFLHGALCVCQSGQCLFSSVVGGNSGNRGLCAQPCRQKYRVKGSEIRGYLLSAHDTHSLETAKQLADAGVSVFKIEGRNRRPEYAGVTSKVYRSLFDTEFRPSLNAMRELSEMYNRGLETNGYLFGENGAIIYSQAQNHIGVKVGVIKNGALFADCQIRCGDGFKVFKADEEVCGGVALQDGIGYVKANFSDTVSDGMTVRRTTSQSLCESVMSAKLKKSVKFNFSAKENEHAVLIAECEGERVVIVSEYLVDKAKTTPIDSRQIEEQLRKVNDTYYTISGIVCEIGDIFLTKGQINALRREALSALTALLINKYNSRFSARNTRGIKLEQISARGGANSLAVICRNPSDCAKCADVADIVIYKPDEVNLDSMISAENCFADLPSFADMSYVHSVASGCNTGFVCHNVGQVEFARKYGFPYVAGAGLNIFNDYIASEFVDARAFVYSEELTLNEIAKFKNKSGYVFVDGDIVLMKLVHCPYKASLKCDCHSCKGDSPLYYSDYKGNDFKIIRRKDKRCSFELINGKKLSAVNKIDRGGRYVIDYDENVVNHYARLNRGDNDGYVEVSPYTKGRLFSKIN